MLAGGTWLDALSEGARFAVQYNPLAAVVTAVIAAALSGYPEAPHTRWRISALVVLVGWLLGDGLRVVGHARDLHDGVATALAAYGAAAWGVLILWAAGTLALGYVLPTVAGASVGRRVTHGTGWLAAASVAGGLSLAISAMVGVLS